MVEPTASFMGGEVKVLTDLSEFWKKVLLNQLINQFSPFLSPEFFNLRKRIKVIVGT